MISLIKRRRNISMSVKALQFPCLDFSNPLGMTKANQNQGHYFLRENGKHRSLCVCSSEQYPCLSSVWVPASKLAVNALEGLNPNRWRSSDKRREKVCKHKGLHLDLLIWVLSFKVNYHFFMSLHKTINNKMVMIVALVSYTILHGCGDNELCQLWATL